MGRGLAFVFLLLGAAAPARAQDGGTPWWSRGNGDAAQLDAPAAATDPPVYAEWQWRRVFSHPRIGSRITAIGVDPENPDRVIAGSEEGTVFQSFDGGATWEERPLYPFVTIDRSLGLQTPSLPALGGFIPSTLQTVAIPPFSRLVGLPTVPYAGYELGFPRSFIDEQPTADVSERRGEANSAIRGATFEGGGSTFPEFFATFFQSPRGDEPNLLAAVTQSRRFQTQPVRTIKFCTGNDFPLLVATKRNLYGSADGGLTYVRLFAVAGTVDILWFACSEESPNKVALATSFGLYRSADGGLTFDLETSGWPGAAVTAVAYGQGGKLFTANGSLLFRGEPDAAEGSVMVYPDYENNATAPWTTIRWIEVTGDQIWLATDDGIRGSLDGGDEWTVPARLMFSRQRIPQVIVGKNETGGDRVAVMLGPGPGGVQGAIWASDDGGENWFPFFLGVTRRSLTMMAAARVVEGDAPRWYVASGHEIWATAEPGAGRRDTTFGGDPELANWARRELQRQPPLAVIIDEAYAHNGLGPTEVRRFATGLSNRAWLPRIDVVFDLNLIEAPAAATFTPPVSLGLFTVVSDVGFNQATNFWQLYIQGTWWLYDAVLANQEWDAFQNQIHEMRRQIAFAVEDAWRERLQHLRRIAGGRLDAYQAEILRMRVESLDASLEIWLGRPVGELQTRRRTDD